MLKNLSMGAILGLAGALFALLVGGTYLYMKSTAKSPVSTQPHKYTGMQPAAATTQRVRASATDQGPASSPAATTQAAFAPAVTPAASATSAAVVAASDLSTQQAIAGINDKLGTVDTRLKALEERAGGTSAGKSSSANHSARHAPARTTAEARPHETVIDECPDGSAVPAGRVCFDTRKATRSNAERDGDAQPVYRTMAVVGDRAWIKTSDGAEDSFTVGDVLPRLRVKAIRKDTGLVITTTDQRAELTSQAR